MDSSSIYLNDSRCGIEVLVLDLTKSAAVKSICILCAKALYVKEVGTTANLLIGSEANADLSVRNICINKSFSRRHNLGNACLVICTEKGCSIGNDKTLTLEVAYIRIVSEREHNILFLIEKDITALVTNHLRLNILAGRIRGGIHVSDEADRGHALAVRRNRAVNVAVLVYTCVSNTDLKKLLNKLLRQHHLSLGGRTALVIFIRSRGIGHVLQKSFVNSHLFSPKKRKRSSRIAFQLSRTPFILLLDFRC